MMVGWDIGWSGRRGQACHHRLEDGLIGSETWLFDLHWVCVCSMQPRYSLYSHTKEVNSVQGIESTHPLVKLEWVNAS